MANDQSIVKLSTKELTHRMQLGEIGALEATEAYIARNQEIHPELNAMVVTRFDEARNEAASIDRKRIKGEQLGPLAGVPISVKECIDVAGTPSTFGIPWRASERVDLDEPHIANLRAAGAIILGKTNVSQLLLYLEADNPVYGRTNNPWNTARTCGGSSGGEGALVAAHGSAFGVGTDIGGSLRAPAAFCGVQTLRPTTGRFNHAGRFSVPLGQQAIRSQIGILARSTDDIELGLRSLAGHPDPFTPIPALGDVEAVDISRLRVGWFDGDGIVASSPSVRRTVREAADALRATGAAVTEWHPPSPETAMRLFISIMGADGGEYIRRHLRGGPLHRANWPLAFASARSRLALEVLRSIAKLLGQEHLARSTRYFGRTRTADYWQLVAELEEYRKQFSLSADQSPAGRLDIILCPVVATPAFRHGATATVGLAGSNTLLHNVTGWPSGVIPWSVVGPDEECDRPASSDQVERTLRATEMGSKGLPVAVQVVARPWHEHQALAVMRHLEGSAKFPYL